MWLAEPSRAQTLSPPTAGWGGVRGEEGTPGSASPFWEPHRPGQSQPYRELAMAASSGKLSSHLPTLSNTRSEADWVAGPFSTVPCWTGGERAG